MARYGSPELALRLGGEGFDALEAVAQTVVALVHGGAEVDARTKNRWTPLHLATWHGSLEAVAALQVAGADVNARNKDGCTTRK